MNDKRKMIAYAKALREEGFKVKLQHNKTTSTAFVSGDDVQFSVYFKLRNMWTRIKYSITGMSMYGPMIAVNMTKPCKMRSNIIKDYYAFYEMLDERGVPCMKGATYGRS